MSVLFNLLIESPSVAVLVEKVKIIDSFQDLDEFDYKGRVNSRENFNFIESALLQFGILFEPFDVDYLCCYFFPASAIDSSVHLSVLALSYLLMKGIAFYYLYHPLVYIFKSISNLNLLISRRWSPHIRTLHSVCCLS